MTINLKTGKSFDLESENQDPMYSTQVVDPAIMAQVQGNPKGLRLLLDSKKRLWAPAAMLTSPQNPLNSYAEIATVEPFLLSGSNPQPGLVTHSYITALRSIGAMATISTGSYLDAIFGNPFALAVQEIAYYVRNAGSYQGVRMGALGVVQVSAINTANVVYQEIRDLHSVVSIYMSCSAASATLLVEVSNDGTTFLTLDTFAAAGNITKNYTPTTLATTIPLFPGAFQFLRVTAGAAGAGNTTTLWVAVK
jgi:hypothetical protein